MCYGVLTASLLVLYLCIWQLRSSNQQGSNIYGNFNTTFPFLLLQFLCLFLIATALYFSSIFYFLKQSLIFLSTKRVTARKYFINYSFKNERRNVRKEDKFHKLLHKINSLTQRSWFKPLPVIIWSPTLRCFLMSCVVYLWDTCFLLFDY